MRQIITVLAVIAILYFLKVDGVVTFVNDAFVPVQATLNYVIDVGTHVRERHPFFYMLLWLYLLFLMRPEYESYTFKDTI